MNLRHRILGSLATATLLLSAAMGTASAETSSKDATIVISPGSVYVGVDWYYWVPTTFSFGPNSTSGELNLRLVDARGNFGGWDASLSGTWPDAQLVPSVTGGTTPILNNPYSQALDPAWLDFSNFPTSIDFNAPDGQGSGDYSANLDLALAIPAQYPSGVYDTTATLTVTFNP